MNRSILVIFIKILTIWKIVLILIRLILLIRIVRDSTHKIPGGFIAGFNNCNITRNVAHLAILLVHLLLLLVAQYFLEANPIPRIHRCDDLIWTWRGYCGLRITVVHRRIRTQCVGSGFRIGTLWVLPPLLLLLPLTGCTHTWTDVTVSVRDVETQVPITNARVQIRPNWLYLPMPESGDPQLNPNARPGEIVTVGEQYGVRISEISPAS